MYKPAVFIWQFRGQDGAGDHDYGSGTLQEDDGQLPISHVFVKALDGVTFMRDVESSSVAIESPDGAQRVALGYRSRGIGMTPWGVHHGESVTSATLEGARAGAVAAAVLGRYMLDLEDGPGYWTGGPEEVAAFLEGAQRAGMTELWICLDSRAGHLAGEQLAAWRASALVTMYYPEVYWPDMQVSVGQAWQDCLAPLVNAGIPMAKIAPVFPGNAPVSELRAAIEEARAGGCPGFAIWRRGTLTEETVTLLTELPEWGTPAPAPTPTPPPAPTPAPEPAPPPSAELATAYSDGYQAAIAALQTAARGVPTTPAVNPYRS